MENNPRSARRLLILLLLLFVLLFIPQRSSAQIKSFSWERYDVDITLLENGDMRVVETQTLNFSGEPFTFGFATIPTGNNGNNDSIEDISVSENGVVYTESSSNRPGTFEVTRDSDEVTIDWYFEPAIGRRTYTFSYTVKGGVRVGSSEEGSGDQIFWKAIPSDHPALVAQSTVTIHLPEGVRPQQFTGTTDYLVAAYIDGQESDAMNITVSDDGRTITYNTTQPLVTGQQLEVRVQFPHGVLPISTPRWQAAEQRGDVLGLITLIISLLILVGGPLLVLLLWYVRGRDPVTGVVVPDYVSEPPDALPPAVAGTLVDEKAEMRDIVSTLVDLARRGYITMTEEKHDHILTRTEKSEDDLRPFERQFLADIFGGTEERKLSSLRYKFAHKLPKLRQMLYEELVREKLVPSSPEGVRNRYGCFSILVFVVALAAFFATMTILPTTAAGMAFCPALALGVTAAALLIASRFMPVKTKKGVEAAAKWSAFKAYLQNVEKYENLAEAKGIFEKYLAYATAFGLERTWINKFSRVADTPVPPWYIPYPYGYPSHRGLPHTGGSPASGRSGEGSLPTLEGMSGSLTGGLQSMSAGLTRMLNSTTTVLQSTQPTSTGTVGRSGGGFSGGFSGGSSGGGGSRGFG
jgi:hypothetical protein